jgi:hypothetical protein
VNKSSLLWKIPTGVAMKSEEYTAAACALQPIQLGLGAKFGMNRLAHTAQDYYSQGFSLGETDAENAFNSASRQKMLEAVVRNCPSWTRLFWMGYCSHRPLVLLRRGSDFEVLRSSEGSRQGCKFGSFVFCLTVQPAYSEVDAAFPGVIFRAATDDLKSFARDPADIIATFPAIASALHRHAGITLNVSKSKVLLPPGVPDIDRIPDGVQVLREGTIVVGAAIGSDEFIRSHVTNIVKAKTQNLQALSLLDPQSALLLLSSCLVPALGYLLQVTPPRIMLEAARMWDVAIDAARHRCMCDPSIGRDPVVGPGLQLLADKKARLPLKLRGLGHYSAALLSPISFYSSYAHHASLDRGTRRRLLLAELRFTIECLRTSLSDCDFQDKIVPAEDIGLKRPGRKLQRELTCDAHSLARTQLIDSIPDSTAGKFDRRAFAIIDKPDSWLPFFVAPTSSDLVVDPQYFIAGLRFYLLLPQLLRLSDVPALVDVPAQDQPNFSYEADPCRHCPAHSCDRHLAHAHACHSSSKSKIRDRHELVKHVRAAAIREAGYSEIKIEPRTNAQRDQRRADIFFVDRSAHKHIHYYTDDCVGHPLCPTHIQGELSGSARVLDKLETAKIDHYADQLSAARTHPSVLAGLRVINFKPCAFTSLGEYGSGTIKFINAAAGYLKKRAVADACIAPRADGSTPSKLSAAFRSSLRAKLQIALMKGNGMIATEVGL